VLGSRSDMYEGQKLKFLAKRIVWHSPNTLCRTKTSDILNMRQKPS
jgi:hypothetical protein